MNKNLLFPIRIDLSRKKVTVIGAHGSVRSRIRELAPCAGAVTWICPDAPAVDGPEETDGKLRLVRRSYVREDLYDADLVIAASESSTENKDIYAACRCLGIPVHTVGDPARSDFFFEDEAVQNEAPAEADQERRSSCL